jgi:5'-3' exoribonuclease 2
MSVCVCVSVCLCVFALQQQLQQQHTYNIGLTHYHHVALINGVVLFLYSNDFLPHLNTLDIGEGAFDLLFRVYRHQRPGWGTGQYLTTSGDITDPARLETFLAAIGAFENETLEDRQRNDADYRKKKRQRNKRDGLPEGPTDADIKAAEDIKQNDYQGMIQELMSNHQNATFVDGWTPVKPGEQDFKGRYYYEKLKLTPLDIEQHHSLRQAYIEGLMWCLAYYYRGCISWGWFFPYHYGPVRRCRPIFLVALSEAYPECCPC